jgi:hypothetical protein
MPDKKQKDRDAEIAQQLAEIGQALINGRKIPDNIPDWQMIAAILIAYTGQVLYYNIKHLHGQDAKEPPTLLNIVDEICKIFGYTED